MCRYQATSPGTILSVVGGLLYWQNAANVWDTWSYVRAWIPASLGLGFVLATLSGLKSRVLAIVGILYPHLAVIFLYFCSVFWPGLDIFALLASVDYCT